MNMRIKKHIYIKMFLELNELNEITKIYILLRKQLFFRSESNCVVCENRVKCS